MMAQGPRTTRVTTQRPLAAEIGSFRSVIRFFTFQTSLVKVESKPISMYAIVWRVSLQDPPYKSLHPSTTRDVLRCQPRIHP